MKHANIRPAAVAGTFYPGDTQQLSEHLSDFLEPLPRSKSQLPKALIVPHAGTIYSGKVAAAAYAQLKTHASQIHRVVLLGPTHRVALRGLGLPTADIFETPLGQVSLDSSCIAELVQDYPQINYSDTSHAEEHSLEVQLPFLQSVLHDFKLIPITVGDASEEEVAQVLDHLWGDSKTLVIISTDLSHFHSYETARKLDESTANLIEQFKGTELQDHSACGRIPLKGLLRLAKDRHLKIQRYDLRNSGDTAGPRDQVVGYGSWGLYET